MAIQFTALATELVEQLQSGGSDANGQLPERHISDGSGLPCRHCLEEIETGAPYLILAFRPFAELGPYSELGPIFLHAKTCQRFAPDGNLPRILRNRQTALIKGYGASDRIKYGTGQIVGTEVIAEQAEDIFRQTDVAYIHVRSAQNNCYTCRIDRTAN